MKIESNWFSASTVISLCGPVLSPAGVTVLAETMAETNNMKLDFLAAAVGLLVCRLSNANKVNKQKKEKNSRKFSKKL